MSREEQPRGPVTCSQFNPLGICRLAVSGAPQTLVKKSWRRIWSIEGRCGVESPLECKEIQPVHSEGDQPWDFFGENDAKAETPVLWPPHAKS